GDETRNSVTAFAPSSFLLGTCLSSFIRPQCNAGAWGLAGANARVPRPMVQGLSMFIFPAIDLRDGRCVRLRQGDYSRETIFSDDPAAVARKWVELGADRLHVVDLDGAKAGKPVNGPVIRRIVETAKVPVQLGGGLRTDADLAAVFDWGIRWAVLGTRALQSPEWVRAV